MNGDSSARPRLDRDEVAAQRTRTRAVLDETVRRHLEAIEQAAQARCRRDQLRAELDKVRAQLQLRRCSFSADERRARAALLEAALAVAGMSVEDLWMDYIALGGNVSPARLEQMLRGEAALPRSDHDRLAVALNERLSQAGHGRPVGYWDGTR